MRPPRASWWPFVLLLAACGGSSPAPGEDPVLPSEQPDVMIVSVSGHGGALSAILCDSSDNVPYLGDPGDAVQALAQYFQGEHGDSIAIANFTDLYVGDAPGRQGFVELVRLLDFVDENWIAGTPDHPTRIVMVAHSHGAVWAHLAASVRPDVPIDYLVTLDGICTYWECEHAGTIGDWIAVNGDPWPFDIADPCGSRDVPGAAAPYDVKDVAPFSVAVNLEVQSGDLLVYDSVDNVRPDGSKDGIETYLASESHTQVDAAASGSMLWVIDRIRVLEDLRAVPPAP